MLASVEYHGGGFDGTSELPLIDALIIVLVRSSDL